MSNASLLRIAWPFAVKLHRASVLSLVFWFFIPQSVDTVSAPVSRCACELTNGCSQLVSTKANPGRHKRSGYHL